LQLPHGQIVWCSILIRNPIYLEGTMNVFELLKEDHKKVSQIFEKLEHTTEQAVKTRDELFGKLKNELEIHTRIEETIFYPVLKEAAETRAIALEAYEEHKVVKELLEEMTSTPVSSEQWTAKFTVLKESVEHHVEEEESDMFKGAREVLTKEQAEELGARMEAEKKQLAAAAKK
jgi:iron-sulfur cluster repair protein YtfE (RIC family)